MPAETQNAFFARFLLPLQKSLALEMPQEYERAKYAELFSVLYIRTGTSTFKEAFQTLKGVVDAKASGDPGEMVCVLDFFLKSALEVTSLISKMQSHKLDFKDDKSAVLWGVYSRTPTLEVVNGVL